MISSATCRLFQVSWFVKLKAVEAKTKALLVVFIGDLISFQIILQLFPEHYLEIIKMQYLVHLLLLYALLLILLKQSRCLLESLLLNHLSIFNLSLKVFMIRFGWFSFLHVIRTSLMYLRNFVWGDEIHLFKLSWLKSYYLLQLYSYHIFFIFSKLKHFLRFLNYFSSSWWII